MLCGIHVRMDFSRQIYCVSSFAPEIEEITDYDRFHFLTYARLLDAADAGADWRDSAETILGVKRDNDEQAAWRCWESHLARARWITGEGLALAIEATLDLDTANVSK